VNCKELLHPLTEFKGVRVLDLEDCESLRNEHLANIEVLLQLRYLNIKGTSVSELPAGIGLVQHLETLDIRWTKVKKLPSTIVVLEKLAHLYVDPIVQFPAEGFSKMKGLEQLLFLLIHGQPLGFLKELGQLTNLKILKAVFNGISDFSYEGSEWGIFTSSLHALCSHKLVHVGIYSEDSTPIPMDSSFPALDSLRAFDISTISSLPSWMGSLVNLELLALKTERFAPEDLRVLGGMPALEALTLIFADNYTGPFTIRGHEFQRLKLFKVGTLYQLQFMPGSMPNLKHLDIELILTMYSHSDLGIQYLASLTKVDVLIYTWSVWIRTSTLEAKLRSLLDAHPNRPALNFNHPYL
jgi:Leucine-rich repeat (LRR) protein